MISSDRYTTNSINSPSDSSTEMEVCNANPSPFTPGRVRIKEPRDSGLESSVWNLESRARTPQRVSARIASRRCRRNDRALAVHEQTPQKSLRHRPADTRREGDQRKRKSRRGLNPRASRAHRVQMQLGKKSGPRMVVVSESAWVMSGRQRVPEKKEPEIDVMVEEILRMGI